jgi:inorganic phosphate transporter, PiT family
VVTPTVVFGGLAGAIAWNLVTWYFGLPSSSSHALIGGVVGAAVVAEGTAAIHGDGLLREVAIPALVAPLTAFLVAGLAILVVYRIAGRLRPGPASRGFRAGQVVSGGLLALAHGTADAQKTMGIITLALVAHGDIAAGDFHVPAWVVLASAGALALGTWSGGWRIIRTMGERVITMNSAQGFTAEGVGSAVILASAHAGFPLSTTHVIAGSIAGAGAGRRMSAVRWGVAGNIVLAWVLTVPAAAAIGAVVYAVTRLFGADSAVGPVVVGAVVLIAATAVFTRRVRRGPPVAAEA